LEQYLSSEIFSGDLIRPCFVKIVDIPSQVPQKYLHKNRIDSNETNSLPEITVIFQNISSKKCRSLPVHNDNLKKITISLVDSEDEDIAIIFQNISAPLAEDKENPLRSDCEIESFVLPESFQNTADGNNLLQIEQEDKKVSSPEITNEKVFGDDVVIGEREDQSSQEEFRLGSSLPILLDPEKLDQEDIFCSSCCINFQTVQEKYKHLQEVHMAKFKCTKCGERRIFNSYFDWKKHFENKHSIKSKTSVHCSKAKNLSCKRIPRIKLLKCNISRNCINYFRSRAERDKHILKNHRKGENFICDYCDYKTIIKYCLVKHIALVHGTENIKCQSCPKYYKSQFALKIHLARVHTEKVCNFCKRTLKRIWEHKKEVICKFCRESFLCKGVFQAHFLACLEKANCSNNSLLPLKIGWKERAWCLYCSKIINMRNMRVHMRRMHSKLKVRCNYSGCIHFFATKIEQQKHHEDVHTVEENLKVKVCNLCSFKTNRIDLLKNHVSRRHGSENLKCVVCSKFFKSQIARTRHYQFCHKNIKTCMLCKNPARKMGEHLKTDKCNECEKVFPCKGLFKIHRDQFHKKQTAVPRRSEREVLPLTRLTSLNPLVCNLFVDGIEEGMEDLQKLQNLTEMHLEKNFPLSQWVYVFTVESPDGCGFGLHCLFFEEAAPTLSSATPVQVQLAAIARAAEKVTEKEVFPLRKSKFVVLSDSRHAIQMAKSSVPLKKLLAVFQGQGKELQVQWIPSGCKFIGKDRAQFLAKMVSKRPRS